MTELPVLIDRTYADFAGDARARIPSFSPNWTDHNPSDPGIAVVELLAWLAEMVLYRIDRVPAKSYRTFLDLLRGPLAPSLDASPLDVAIRDTIADLRARHRAITSDDFEFLALHRWPTLPNVPTIAELGYPEVVYLNWQGIFAPAGTLPEIVARLRKEVSAVLAEPDEKQFLIGIGAAPVESDPTSFDAMLKADYVANQKIVNKLKLKVD